MVIIPINPYSFGVNRRAKTNPTRKEIPEPDILSAKLQPIPLTVLLFNDSCSNVFSFFTTSTCYNHIYINFHYNQNLYTNRIISNILNFYRIKLLPQKEYTNQYSKYHPLTKSLLHIPEHRIHHIYTEKPLLHLIQQIHEQNLWV